MIRLLTVAFVVLKLTGHIDWNWFLIFTPFFVSTIIESCVTVYEDRQRKKIKENFKTFSERLADKMKENG